MRLSGAMMLFLVVFFLWNCFTMVELLVCYDLARKERLWLFGYLLLCALGVALFGVGAVYEIVRLVRVYG